jgi:hypothetical protein
MVTGEMHHSQCEISVSAPTRFEPHLSSFRALFGFGANPEFLATALMIEVVNGDRGSPPPNEKPKDAGPEFAQLDRDRLIVQPVGWRDYEADKKVLPRMASEILRPPRTPVSLI